MNDVDDSDHELTDEQRDKLRKAIGEIIGDFTPWILCVDTTPIIGDSRVSYSSNVSSEHASVYELIGLMEHELIPVYTKFTGNGVRVQNDSKLIDYLDDGWKIINVTAANPLALDNNEAVVLYVIERTTANHWSKRNE